MAEAELRQEVELRQGDRIEAARLQEAETEGSGLPTRPGPIAGLEEGSEGGTADLSSGPFDGGASAPYALVGGGERSGLGGEVAEGRKRSAFSDDFQRALRRRDDPPAALEAGLAGPWQVAKVDATFVVHDRAGCRAAVCEEESLALLLAAVLPGLGRCDSYAIGDGDRGFELLRGGEPVAWLGPNLRDLLPALHAADALLRSPTALASLLEAAGSTVLSRTGAILYQRVTGSPHPP